MILNALYFIRVDKGFSININTFVSYLVLLDLEFNIFYILAIHNSS